MFRSASKLDEATTFELQQMWKDLWTSGEQQTTLVRYVSSQPRFRVQFARLVLGLAGELCILHKHKHKIMWCRRTTTSPRPQAPTHADEPGYQHASA